jgi:hypothetical protein
VPCGKIGLGQLPLTGLASELAHKFDAERFHFLSFCSSKLMLNSRLLSVSSKGQYTIVRPAVITENSVRSVRSENTGVPIIREIMVATTMSSLFVALFALLASSFPSPGE